MISSPITERPCYKHRLLLIKSAEFRVQKPVSKDLWGPIPVPPHVSKSAANVATHRLVYVSVESFLGLGILIIIIIIILTNLTWNC